MPSESAAALALLRSREAMARSSVSVPFFMPGRRVFSAKRLAPRTPQRTGDVVSLLGVEFGTAGMFDPRCAPTYLSVFRPARAFAGLALTVEMRMSPGSAADLRRVRPALSVCAKLGATE